MKTHRWTTPLILSLALVTCGDETGLTAVDLQGTWIASVYEYTDNANSQNVVDLIQRDGASFTLTVDASGSATTGFLDGFGGSDSDSGSINASGTTLTLTGDAYVAARSGNVLTLLNPDDDFDFGTGSDRPATLRIVLNRS